MFIEDGQGKGNVQGVNDENRALVHAITESELGHAVEFGLAYNVNTGSISLSGNSAVFYYKHNEDRNFIVSAIAIGSGAGTLSDQMELFIVKNPKAGTIISNAVAVDMNQNRQFGSSETLLNSLAYKGVNGDTFTDGEDLALFYQGANSRGYYSIDVELPKGSSLGVRIEPNLSSGSIKVYCALIGYLKPFTEV